MVQGEEVMDIIALYRTIGSIKGVCRKTKRARNTVRAIVRGTHGKKVRKQRASKLDAYKAHISKRYEDVGLSAKRLYEEIRGMGYDGSYDLVQLYVKKLKTSMTQEKRLTVRFETPPGRQAQADWLELGAFPDAMGKHIKLYVFVMVLGYSRYLYAEMTQSMKLHTLLRCHVHAFEAFGGVPAQILYDNMATIRDIQRTRINSSFQAFATHYGFAPKLCRVRRPRTKGKVERGIGYLQDSFLPGRQFHGLDDANAQLRHWLAHEANARIHGTTKEKPSCLLAKEQARLTALERIAPFPMVERHERRADYEGFVRYKNNFYCVGAQGAGQQLFLDLHGITLRIRDSKERLLVEHPIVEGYGQRLSSKAQRAELWRLSVENPAKKKSVIRSFGFSEEPQVETRQLGVYQELLS